MKRILHFSLFICAAFLMKAQIPISGYYPTDSVFFDFNNYAGNGFSVFPITGQLNSGFISIKPGGTQPILPFLGNQITANTIYTRGTTANPVTTAGFYAFKVNPLDTSDKAFGFQQTGTFMSGAPGSANNGIITLRFKNLTTKPIFKLNLKYDMYVRNDQPRGSLIRLQGGTDTLTQTSIPNGTYKSKATAVASAPWTKDTTFDFLLNNVNVPVGADYYLSFLVSDSTGSGSRDEIAIDNFKLFAFDSITINPSVIVNANFTASATAICKGSSVSFTNTTSTIPANTPLIYFWDFKDGGIDTIANPSHQFNTTGTFNVVMYAVDTISAAFDSMVMTIQVGEIPNANFTISNTGTSYTYTAPATPLSNLSYAWTLNGALVGSSQPNYNNVFTVSGSYNICLKIVNPIGGCKDSVCQTVNVVVPPNNTLSVNITISDSVICVEDSAALTAISIAGGTPPYTSAWFLNGNPIPAPVLGQLSAVNNTGLLNIVLLVTDSNNFVKTDTAKLLVLPLPNANFTLTPSLGNPSQYILSPAGSLLFGYTLFVNGVSSVLSGSAPYLVTFPGNGTYNVCLKAFNSITTCTDSTCKTINVVISSLNKIESLERVSIFPNPAKEMISIEQLKDKATVNIYNAIGQLVKKVAVDTSNHKINVNSLQSGMYFLEVRTAKSTQTIRLAIQ